MALPVTISGSLFTGVEGNLGPFISSGGNVYVLGCPVSPNTLRNLGVWKATDPTASFSLQDDAAIANGSNEESLSAVQEGDLLHIVGSRLSAVRYYQFDMSTDLWVTTGYGLVGGSSVNIYIYESFPTIYAVDIAVRSDGDLVVVYHGENPATMGGRYQEIAYSRWEGTSWTNGIVIASTAAKDDDYTYPNIAIGSTGQAHITYTRYNVTTRHLRCLSSANALRTQRTVTTALGNPLNANPTIYERSGTEIVANSTYHSLSRGVTTWDYFDDDTNPTFTRTEIAGGVGNSAWSPRIACDFASTNQDLFYPAGGFDDLYTNSTGTTWSLETTDYITDASTPFVESQAVFQRGDNIVFAFLYPNGSSVPTYDEYIIRTLSTLVTGTGDLPIPAAALQGTGEVTVTGSGAMTIGLVALQGTAERIIPGSGALDIPSAALQGTGERILTASGDLGIPASVLAATGKRTLTGTGALDVPATALLGTAERTIPGSGALDVPASVLAATGERTITGTGALDVPTSALASTGERTLTGSGALDVALTTLQATGKRTLTGTGVLIAPSALLASAGERTVTGSGNLQIPASVLAATGFAGAVEYMRPGADSAINGWTDELDGVVNIYQSIDEVIADDGDYIKSADDPVTDIYRTALTDPASTVATDAPQLIKYRYRKQGSGTANLVVRLIEGASTVIATWTHNGVTSAFAQAEQTLTTPQKAAITNYADLSLEFEADVP